MAGPQRGTAARGKRQGILDRAEKKYGKSGVYNPAKINQFRGRGVFDYEELLEDKERAISKPRRTMSEKDRDLAVRSELADAGMRLDRLREEDPKMYLALKQGDMDRAMRRGAEQFKGSSEDDSPGYSKGGGVKKMNKGGMPDLTGDGKVTRADVLKGRGVFKRGGNVSKFGPRYGFKRFAKGGSVSSASKRADGCAVKGKTKGRFV